MIAIPLFAALLGVGLFLLIARFGAPLLAGRRRRDAATDLRPPISSALLRALTTQLLEALGLRVVDDASDDAYLVATKREPLGEVRYVVALAAATRGGVVGQAEVVALAEDVKSEHAAVGILVTPGEIETEGLAGLEVELELVDGRRFRQLIAEYLPVRLEQLDRHRGFSASESSGHSSVLST